MVKELACVAMIVSLPGVCLDALHVRSSPYRFVFYLVACFGVCPLLWLTHAVGALCRVCVLTLASAAGLWRWRFKRVEPQQFSRAAFRVRRHRWRRFVERVRPHMTYRQAGTRLTVRTR